MITARVQARITTLRSASAAIIDDGGGENGRQESGRQAQEDRFTRVFHLSMGVYTCKYSMNFLMNLCNQLGIAGILGVGGWFVVSGRTEVGTVVAFLSGLAIVKDPWDDLTSWFQAFMVTRARYTLLADVFLGRETAE